MQQLATIRPAPPAPPTGDSVSLWVGLGVILAVVVIAGYVLALRR